MSEFWDAYDAEMNLLEGVVLVRDEAIPAGMYHLIRYVPSVCRTSTSQIR